MTSRSRVLYIDDDEGLRELVRRVLERRGYSVAVAASGDEGLARLRDERFDLVALDHYMPGQDGFTTLQAIRTLSDPPPVVYVTGSDESRIAVAALKAGASDYVVKTPGADFYDLLQSAFEQALGQVRLRRGHAEAQEALAASNRRLETLLREVNHRVANSLQLVSAFVQMQAAALEDETSRAALKDTQRRIEAIGQVHRRLYTSDNLEVVDMQDYLEALCRELEDTWSTPAAPRRLQLAVEPIQLTTDHAVSLGVIVNELITNACKYAYDAATAGEVRIGFAREPSGDLLLSVEDDGPGMGDGSKPQGTGLGARLVHAMALSLKSTVEYDQRHTGVRATLRVPA